MYTTAGDSFAQSLIFLGCIGIATAFFWGFIAESIGKKKNIQGFWLGFFLGIFGILIVCLMEDRSKPEQVNTQSNHDLNKYDQLQKLEELRKTGVLSEEEFVREKEKLLN